MPSLLSSLLLGMGWFGADAMPNGRKRIRGLLGFIRTGEEMVEVGLGGGASEVGDDGAGSREGSRSAQDARERRGTGVGWGAYTCTCGSLGLAGPGNLVSRPLSDVDRQLLHSSRFLRRGAPVSPTHTHFAGAIGTWLRPPPSYTIRTTLKAMADLGEKIRRG
jgi:hypothetical protein